MPSPTVLVVDDDPVILRLLEVSLELGGFSVLRAHDGPHGVEVARAAQPDLVISDVTLPRDAGVGMVSALKGDVTTRAIPVILLSPTPPPGHAADDCVTTPFAPIDVVDRVNRLLNR